MIRSCSFLGACIVALAGCQAEPDAGPTVRVSKSGGVINLLTIEKVSAGATLAIHHGVFRREGPCLVLEADGTSVTPVFPTEAGVAVNGDGIRFAGLDFPFGDTIALPGLGPSYSGEAVGQCPVERRLVRAVEAVIRPQRPGH